MTVKDIRNPDNWSFETKQVHSGQEQPSIIHSRRWRKRENTSWHQRQYMAVLTIFLPILCP